MKINQYLQFLSFKYNHIFVTRVVIYEKPDCAYSTSGVKVI